MRKTGEWRNDGTRRVWDIGTKSIQSHSQLLWYWGARWLPRPIQQWGILTQPIFNNGTSLIVSLSTPDAVDLWSVSKRCPSRANKPTPSASAPLSLRALISKQIPITSRQPCRQPVTKKTPQVLHPSTPSLAAKLADQTKLPGVWISIIGMLKLPTCPNCQVIQICGRYCIPANIVAMIPSVFAHLPRWFGRDIMSAALTIMTSRPCSKHRKATVSAVRHVYCFSAWLLGRGGPRGKKTRKRSKLRIVSTVAIS